MRGFRPEIHAVHGGEVPPEKLCQPFAVRLQGQNPPREGADPGQHFVGVEHIGFIDEGVRGNPRDMAVLSLPLQTVQEILFACFVYLQGQPDMLQAAAAVVLKGDAPGQLLIFFQIFPDLMEVRKGFF